MIKSLQVGIEHEIKFVVPQSKTVPKLYPELEEFGAMPEVFATGYLVGLLEWTCMQAVNPYLDFPHELTLGTRINVSHEAATPPGLEVTVRVKLTKVDGRRLEFDVEANDGIDIISRGTHERFIVDAKRFSEKVASKVKE
ncbi:thioesterase family protein [bacterium LRH843]|nr:thioesterase family protein [bacterium LRH843]